MSDELVIRRRAARSPRRCARGVSERRSTRRSERRTGRRLPGFPEHGSGGRASGWASGALSALLHASIVGGLLLFAWFAPVVEEEVIPVQLIHEELPEVDQARQRARAGARRRWPSGALPSSRRRRRRCSRRSSIRR